MRKFLLLLIIVVLGVAYFTKPDDKTCKIEGVRAVWGNVMPDVNNSPSLFEEFMNLNHTNVIIKDWVIFKQIQYKIREERKTVAYGAFKNVFTTVSPINLQHQIPPMPAQGRK